MSAAYVNEYAGERATEEYTTDDLEMRVAELCENVNEEIAYTMLWSGKAYSPKEARETQAAKEHYAQAA